MKKNLLSCLFLGAFAAFVISSPAYALKYKFVVPTAPVPTPEVQKQINQYKQGNYVGAMVELENMLRANKDNDLARYYLALCYTRLGYKEEAKKAYTDLMARSSNDVLRYYSERSMKCLENPTDETCTVPPGHEYNLTEDQKLAAEAAEKNNNNGRTLEQIDIGEFIKSGKKIHPAAMDTITKERMERKIQEDEYRRLQDKDGIKMDVQSYNGQPTNEEIASALNTLSKIGINPFRQNMYDMGYLSNNEIELYPQMYNRDFAEMLMYNNYNNYNYRPELQMNSLMNSLTNYGI